MSEIMKPKKKAVEIERVALSKEAMARLDQWLAQLSAKYTGLKMKRADLADWIITNRAAAFTDEEVHKIGEKFYDQIHLANWILRQVKEAKAAGKTLTIADIMRSSVPSK